MIPLQEPGTRALPRALPLAIGALALSCATALGALAAGAPEGMAVTRASALHTQIARVDAELFDALVTTCDSRRLRDLVAADVEFVHPNWGTVARGADELAGLAEKLCERRARGREPAVRREPVAGSVEVFALGEDGAIELGRQRWFAQDASGQWQALGETRFTQLWRRQDGQWRAARILQFDQAMAAAR